MVLKNFSFAREERAFLREEAISFFIGDTDPGNLTTFQKQSLVFYVTVFHFNFSFSQLCTNCKQVSKRGRRRCVPDVILYAGFTSAASSSCFYKLHISQLENG